MATITYARALLEQWGVGVEEIATSDRERRKEADFLATFDGVRNETDSMTAAGFPMMRIETDGGHYDDAGAIENGHAVPGTSADLAMRRWSSR